MEGLPPDATSMENACLITYNHSQSWPLILDRSGMVEAWLTTRLKDPVIFKYNVRWLLISSSSIFNCFCDFAQCPDSDVVLLSHMTDGATVVVTHVDVVDLSSNKAYMDVLQSRRQLYCAKARTKIIVGLHLVCHGASYIFTIVTNPRAQYHTLCSCLEFFLISYLSMSAIHM